MKLQLSVWAEDLLNQSLLGSTDPFAVVTLLSEESGTVPPTLLGKTEVIHNTLSPDWTKTFIIEDFCFGEVMKVAISIYDAHRNNHPLGSVVFELGAVLGADGSIAAKEMKDGGTVVVLVEEVTSTGTLSFQFRGTHFKHLTDDGTTSKIDDCDPFFELQRLRRSVKNGARVWDCVYRSSPTTNSIHPKWNDGHIDISSLCGNNPKQKLRFAVYNYDTLGEHEFMGDVKFTIRNLLRAVTPENTNTASHNDMNTDKALILKKLGQEVGKIIVCAAEVSGIDLSKIMSSTTDGSSTDPDTDETGTVSEEELSVATASDEITAEEDDDEDNEEIESTFVNYIAGGCELHVIVAIDATASNGDPNEKTSLHHFKDNGRNDYEEALFALCTILSKYDADQMYPVFGFGAKRGAVVDNCFTLGPDTEVKGVDGIVNVYRKTFRSGLVMSGPRDFSDVIRTAADNAEAEMGKGQAYSILLIFTNGTPMESLKTLAALDEANSAPISFVIVGVGDGDFSGMERYEKRHMVERVRDNLRFVHFDALKKSRTKLRKAALNDIPSQLEEYFKSRGIRPNPGPSPDEVVVQPYNEAEEIQVPLEINEAGEAVITGCIEPRPEEEEYKPSSVDNEVPATEKKYVNSKNNKTQLGKVKRRLRNQGKKFLKNVGIKL